MINRTFLRSSLSITLIFGSMLLLPSCFRCIGVYCENGSCKNGVCECDEGYYGENCEFSTASSSGYVCVSGSCSYVSSDASYITLNECYTDCGSSLCNYDVYSDGSCAPGNVPVSISSCCPTSNPYYCSETGYCYTTCESADAACATATVILGTTGSGNAGYSCIGGTCISVSSGATYATYSDCQTTCASTTYTLNDSWLGSDGTGFTISGTTGAFYVFGGNWQLMANSGYVSIGTQKYRYISTLTANTWSCQVLFLHLTDGVPDSIDWSTDGTITMSGDGNTITVAATSPYTGTPAQASYTRQ